MDFKNFDKDIIKVRKIENEIFDIQKFNENVTVFPENVFREVFDQFFILNVADWFHNHNDFENLLTFVKANNSDQYYSSCPSLYGINPVKILVDDSFEQYVSKQTYNNAKNRNKGLGIRKSGETFYFDDTKNWAILNDITNNITIIGLKNKIIDNFKSAFKGKFQELNALKQIYDEKTMNIILKNYSKCR